MKYVTELVEGGLKLGSKFTENLGKEAGSRFVGLLGLLCRTNEF